MSNFGPEQPLRVETPQIPPTFFEQYQPVLKRLFEATGIDVDAASSLGDAFTATREWKQDGYLPIKDETAEDLLKSTVLRRTVFGDLDLTADEKPPFRFSDPQIDQVIVLGDTFGSDRDHLRAIRKAVKVPSEIILLGGERPIDWTQRSELIAGVNELSASDPEDIWSCTVAAAAKRGDRRHIEAELTNSTSSLLLAARWQLSPLRLTGLSRSRLDPHGEPRRYDFMNTRGLDVTLLHHPDRLVKVGEGAEHKSVRQKPSIEDSIANWITAKGPFPEDRTIAIMAASPQRKLAVRVAQEMLRKSGWQGELLSAGVEAKETPDSLSYKHFLEQVAAHLSLDIKLTQPDLIK